MDSGLLDMSVPTSREGRLEGVATLITHSIVCKPSDHVIHPCVSTIYEECLLEASYIGREA